MFIKLNILRNIVNVLTKPIKYTTSVNSKLNRLLVKMPRDQTHVKEAQKQRIKIKQKNSKYIPGTVNLQILGCGTHGSPASVYMFTDQQRYLFNCGEGTQRLAHEHKSKLARLEHIFLTRNSWCRTGGLPGLCLTVQDAGIPTLSLHGPPGIDEIFTAMRRFVILKDLKVDAPQCNENEFYDDSVMTVFYVPIISQEIKLSDDTDRMTPPMEDCTDYYSHEGDSGSENHHDKDFLKLEMDKTCINNSVMAYICKLKPRTGPLNLEKCVEKGVPPGPLLGQLKNGMDVILPNGNVVKADDVITQGDPGPAFIVLDIPSQEYLPALESKCDQFLDYFVGGSYAENMSLVIHFSSNDILNSDIYKNFIKRFPAHTVHLCVNESNSFSGNVAAHRIQVQLNQLNDHVFPLLREPDVICGTEFAVSPKKFKYDLTNLSPETHLDIPDSINYEKVTAMSLYHLRPHNRLDRSVEQKLFVDEYIQETLAIPEFPESLENLKNKISQLYLNVDRNLEYPKIVFLGTGSCIPNKTRNVSAILVHVNRNSCILLDCGEGTAGQIIRLYGIDGAKEIFQKLNLVYVSHLHADHHIGLIGILKTRRILVGDNSLDKLLLLAPKQIAPWLYFYNKQIEKLNDDYELLGNADMLSQPLRGSRIYNIGINCVTTCLVRHCPHSFGVAFELQPTANQLNPVKITYSGDTMPCSELLELGQDSTVLIHEATMEDELVYEAKLKMHSTMSQAIEQGQKMNAKYILLTHFSQRYAKLPRLDNILNSNVGIAFDNMEVTLFDLPHLNIMYPTLKLLFIEHCEEMEQKALKRAYKRQRELELEQPINNGNVKNTKNVHNVI